MKEPQNRNYIRLYDFMIKDFDLRMPEYLIYALAYSYYSTGGILVASKERLADRFNCSASTVYRAINSLEERGFIKNTVIPERNLSSYRVLRREPEYEKKEKPLPFGPGGKVFLTEAEYRELFGRVGYERLSSAVEELDIRIRKNPAYRKSISSYTEELERILGSSGFNNGTNM